MCVSGYNFKTQFKGHVVLSNTFILCLIYAATAQLLGLYVLFMLQFFKTDYFTIWPDCGRIENHETNVVGIMLY